MDSEATFRAVVRYSGRVQGVGFRMTTVSLSEGLQVHGTVRNENDGTVLLDVEGDRKDVDRLLDRIRREMNDNIRDTHVTERPPTSRTGGLKISY